jgi:molecular chaperone GrpE
MAKPPGQAADIVQPRLESPGPDPIFFGDFSAGRPREIFVSQKYERDSGAAPGSEPFASTPEEPANAGVENIDIVDGDNAPDQAGDGLPGDAAASEVVEDELQDMDSALAAAQLELATHKEAMLRMQAEMENLRKRLIRDLERSRKFALERMMKDLLQVRDSLERAVDIDDDTATVESLKEGKALTLKMLGKVMEDHGLEVVDPKGEPFNPEWHEAMTMLPSDEVEENTVLEVLQKGFKLHDRLIRPAMVVVSSKP